MSSLEEDALSKWAALQPFGFPPVSDVPLAERGGCRLAVDRKWGPQVGYFRYVPLKGRSAAVANIPEVQGWPELAQSLRLLNDQSTAVETLGCGVIAREDRIGDATAFVESYIDLFFSQPELQPEPKNSIRLAAHMLQSVEGCERWWAQVLISLQQLRKGNPGANDHWSLEVCIRNHGRSEANARELWAKTLNSISQAAANFVAT
jgi:hypothetical protein